MLSQGVEFGNGISAIAEYAIDAGAVTLNVCAAGTLPATDAVKLSENTLSAGAVIEGSVSSSSFPTRLPAVSVNQRLPSGPVVMLDRLTAALERKFSKGPAGCESADFV